VLLHEAIFSVACEQALWSGKEGRKLKERKKKRQRVRTSEETGRVVGKEGQEEPQSTHGSLRSLIYFRAFPHCGACSQAIFSATCNATAL